MPVKRYGIYLFYTPATDLRGEGLGRYLSALLKSAEEREDIRFAIACPSWTRRNLSALCQEEGVDEASFDVIAPPQRPLVLDLIDAFRGIKKSPRGPGPLRRLLRRGRQQVRSAVTATERWLLGNRSVALLIGFILVMLPVALLGAVLLLVGRAIGALGGLIGRARIFHVGGRITSFVDWLSVLVAHPSSGETGRRLFHLMEESEIARVHALIRDNADVKAWYCPTSFWPHFNLIQAPRVMCVPDVVPIDFPGAFAVVGGKIGYNAFREIEVAIGGGRHFITYSHHVKWHTLVDRYQIDPDAVFVVQHGINRLDPFVSVTGGSNDSAATDAFCRTLFAQAFRKSIGNRNSPLFDPKSIRFIFFAGKFRPSKNMTTLLRSFENILKNRFRSYKLILTGNPFIPPEIMDFIREHNLENDVLCLNGLTVAQLAACYRLADLAVNPSLSEGGFPFSFAEALSVGTPIVMARIPVTEEVIGNEEFYADMTFDPYDWRDLADRIEWALDHRAELLARQHAFYRSMLARRTWRHALDDHIAILDRIAAPSAAGTTEYRALGLNAAPRPAG